MQIPWPYKRFSLKPSPLQIPTYDDTSMNQRASSWAKALEQAEQGSLRTMALLGAAQLRLGLIDQALATLRQREPMPLASDHHDFRWEQLRRSMEILCLHRQGKDSMEAHRRAIGVADFVHKAHARDIATISITWPPTTQEALRTQGTGFASSQMSTRVRPGLKAASVPIGVGFDFFWGLAMKSFGNQDTNGDGILSASEYPEGESR